MKFLKRALIVLTVIATGIVSCDSTNSGSENPPQMPPAESMSADFSEMDNANSKTAAKQAESNFNTAFVVTAVAKAIVQANAAIPRALLTAASNQEAEFTGEGSWEWYYSATENGNSYGVKLTAEAGTGNEVDWKFYVTNSQQGWDNQLFVSGTANREATSGTWTYYDLSNGEEAAVTTWAKAEGSQSLTLEVLSDRNDKEGDRLEYTFENDVKTLILLDASEGNTTTISFNVNTYTGFIISPDYNNGEKSCWDENLNNVSCS